MRINGHFGMKEHYNPVITSSQIPYNTNEWMNDDVKTCADLYI